MTKEMIEIKETSEEFGCREYAARGKKSGGRFLAMHRARARQLSACGYQPLFTRRGEAYPLKVTETRRLLSKKEVLLAQNAAVGYDLYTLSLIHI